MEQTPAVQVVLSQGAEVEHTVHVPPVLPQAVIDVPALQVVPVQQPVQVLAVQVPPQPSLAPRHLLVQSGTQTHWPALQVMPVAQVPQVPLQPLEPHTLPAHLGVHGVHRPVRQIMALAVQSTQLPPPVPHSSCVAPVTQPFLGEQHPAQVLLLQPHTASGQGPVSLTVSWSRSRTGVWSGQGGRSAVIF